MDDRGEYNKWIVILQEFDLNFISAKSNKLLVFVKLVSYFASLEKVEIHEDSFVDEHIFHTLTVDPWYGDIILFTDFEGPSSPLPR